MTEPFKFHDGNVDFTENAAENKLIIKRTQHIPDDWLMANRKQREDSMGRREGEMMPVATIPIEVVDWMKRVLNYDVFTEPVKRTVALLKEHHMDDFILTNKSL
jgi:hypothetical protein